MKQIISFSRRTDGIAFYIDRLEKAIEEEVIDVRNPINKKVSQVSLKPCDVAGFVLWSKNFHNFLIFYIYVKLLVKRFIRHILLTHGCGLLKKSFYCPG